MYSHLFPLCQLACPPARVQRPLLHAGNPGGPEPAGGGGEEGAEVQLQEEEGEAGETLQHQGGVACQVHPGDRGQAGDSEPGVGRALCVVSTVVRPRDEVHVFCVLAGAALCHQNQGVYWTN